MSDLVTELDQLYFAATPTDEWLQIQLNEPQTLSGVTMQGRAADSQQYVKTFYVALSSDGQSFSDVIGSDGTRLVSEVLRCDC